MLGKRMKRSRVREQRKIIVSGIINDHVTLRPLPRRVSSPSHYPRGNVHFSIKRREPVISPLLFACFSVRAIFRANVCGVCRVDLDVKILSRGHQNGYVSLQFAVHRENKSRLEGKLETLKQETPCVRSRRLSRDRDSDGTFTPLNSSIERGNHVDTSTMVVDPCVSCSGPTGHFELDSYSGG